MGWSELLAISCHLKRAAVKPTISLLKVSDIETEAPPSPCTNYGKLVKS